MKPRCPTCNSVAAYTEGPNYVCMSAGHRYPINNGVQPIVINKIIGGKKIMSTTEKCSAGKKGTCANCGRERFITDKNGHCSTCHNAVKGLEVDSAAYVTALADVKASVLNPNWTPWGKQKGIAKTSAKKIRSASSEKKSLLDTTIKEVARVGIPGIIQKMREERQIYLSEAEKLSKAINVLERL